MKALAAALAVVSVSVALTGCGGSSASSEAPAPTLVDILAGEQAVRAEFAARGGGLWQVATYTGSVHRPDAWVAVDLCPSRAGGGRRQHRSVSVPDLTVSDPLEGGC